ncbi:MAG: hypothetical protein BGO01_20565 [Armatimonadetes bacterium 55-13]|nr:hypothetical protein [Armatimonadota bacterium]OJU64505.1 MAG: hypothetical protein BGO01_20565 [Armatimonadetes bacterium 55-13]
MTHADRLVTVFLATGADQVLGAFNKLSTAQERYAAAMNRFHTTSGAKEMKQAYEEARVAARDVINENLKGAAKLAGAFTIVAFAITKMTDSYVDFATKVMNLSQLTGSSLKDSARAVVLGRVTGLDASVVKDLARPSRSVFTAQGQAGLSRLGIMPNPNASGLDIFNQVAERLGTMKDGLRKTQIMAEIFGEKGAESLLPLLRLTSDQRRAVTELADSYDTGASQAIQRFSFASDMAGETLLQRVIYPIAEQLLPVLTMGVELLTLFANWWGNLNDILGGVPNWIVAMTAFGGAVALVVGVVGKLQAAFRMAAAAALDLGVKTAIAEFMAGDLSALGRIFMGGAIVGGAMYGLSKLMDSGDQKSEPMKSAAEKIDNAADKFTSAVNRMGDRFDDLKGHGMPSHLSQLGIGRLAREMNLGAIG